MLIPKENQPVSEPPSGGSNSAGVKIAILFGAVIALIAASVYLFYQLSQVRDDLNQTRDSMLAEISKLHETSAVSTQTSRRTVDALKAQVEKYRSQAAQAERPSEGRRFQTRRRTRCTA